MFIISRLKALGNRLPGFSGDERRSLRAAIAAHGRDWDKAAEFVATKDSLHCQAQATLCDTPYTELHKKRLPFSPSDLKRLNDIVKTYGASDWKLIAKNFGDSRKPKFLKFHYNLGLSTLNRQPWTKEEDQYIISSMFQEKVPTWSQLSDRLGRTRSPQLIRARWAQINPAARTGEWTDEEKTLLNSLVKKHGIVWHNIAKMIKSRTSEDCHQQWFKMNYPTLNSSMTVRKK
ncbi:Myb- protein A [Entomophthora muscae]|uniref:Myb- protein A n=2 Tax=Entomophthora muscae TaxID=34485 RepID=A0ACC2SC72_9FUNG|nr:Myb- protein A [Entomophthora muscae]KAJ9070511.1 Myb- protein A [Entomophthora muscae]